jgi:hypothetical protein
MTESTRDKNKRLKRLNKQMPHHLIEQGMPEDAYPKGCIKVWRSNRFLVQEYQWIDDAMFGKVKRLSVCRTSIDRLGRWLDKVSWDELQRLKDQCGYRESCAVEIYPPGDDLVDVANMRHLWVLEVPPGFMWKDEKND